jgi:hypothetical protein
MLNNVFMLVQESQASRRPAVLPRLVELRTDPPLRSEDAAFLKSLALERQLTHRRTEP